MFVGINVPISVLEWCIERCGIVRLASFLFVLKMCEKARRQSVCGPFLFHRMNNKNSGVIKIVSGVFLMFASVFGFIFGQKAKRKFARILIYILSAISLLSGYYLFINGLNDYAVGVVGQYRLGKEQPRIQGMVYKDKEAFMSGLVQTFERNPDTRRLKFRCNDESNRFTVYNTFVGIIGIPDKNIKCNDGMMLLEYKN